MRGTLLSVFVLSMLPASTALWRSAAAEAVDGRAGALVEANEPDPSQASEAEMAGVEGDSVASCVATCPKGDKVVTCPDGVCQCHCDDGGRPVCKCE
ncbi:hypothetical protein [Sorangium cellulosum]|uniref:hypothetical protein n=1 Tax=Sorangium cellulosum TaxID=56 RepID=UPI0012FF6CC2|nr:hypothetical protein [Sorangium cellulosum]